MATDLSLDKQILQNVLQKNALKLSQRDTLADNFIKVYRIQGKDVAKLMETIF